MDYRVVFGPDVHVDPEAFAEAWNETDACRECATAVTRTPDRPNTFEPGLGEIAVFLTDLATGLTAAALYDLIKSIVESQGSRTKTTIKKIDRPDEKILVVERIEET